MFKKIRRYVKDPYYSLGSLFSRIAPQIMPDKWYLSVLYKQTFGREMAWRTPQTYNEKLNWMKLYNRNPLYTTLADKIAVKQYVADKIGDKYVIPTLLVYDNAEEIDLDQLPSQFVLKCNHDSGSFVICKDKSTFNLEEAKRKLAKCLDQDFYLIAREWPYKNIPRRILAERYMSDKDQKEILTCCKFFCFNGEPKIFQLTDKSDDFFENFYDMEGNLLDLSLGFRRDESRKRPVLYPQMLEVAKKLCKDMPHVRVDLYEIDGKIYFGEYTFFNWGGFNMFTDEKWDNLLGSWIELPEK